MIRAAAALRAVADEVRASGRRVGFVPTMGALHAGHASLLRRARRERPFVVMSLFVNPLQFVAGEDFERYPRDEAADLAVAERSGVDVVWAPSLEEMYPPGVALPEPAPGPLGEVLEGAARPGHFAGVLKAIHRLLDVAGPSTAYFGEKDAQQLFLVRRMILQLALPIEAVGCPIVREGDGLALSSRNVYLSPEERDQAGCLFLALTEAAELARRGERDAGVLRAATAREIGATPLARLEYATVVDDATFDEVSELTDRPSRALVAASVGSTRLIDNVRLSPGERVDMLTPRPSPGPTDERDLRVLLAVDVGNTEIVLGVFRGSSLEHHWRMSTMPERTSDELALLLSGFLSQRGMAFESMISGVVIASVVPAVTEALRDLANRYFPFPPVVVGPGTKTGVPVLTDNPREVGADRIVNALAAFTRFGGPAIVVDFGTGTNFDVVSDRGEFLGGVIAPGLQVSAASLVHRTARLTRVELAAPKSVVGKNTVEAIQSGLIFGTAGEVDGIVERIRIDLGGSAVVIATGGLAPVVLPHCRSVDHHEPWLTLEGLRLVFDKNVVTADG